MPEFMNTNKGRGVGSKGPFFQRAMDRALKRQSEAFVFTTNMQIFDYSNLTSQFLIDIDY